MRLFDTGVVVHVPTSDRSGYLVSLDGGADTTGRGVVAVVRDAVGNEQLRPPRGNGRP
ncbi:hypothetical protein [Halobacterium sp. R2-5]|uniref:hypothetical protein n=1 Tax=Halobacterium sp. R2-5 TaxID=2715751 RepID=UPI0014221E7E|nr:hypothetical protein [Halobacterium sp. R2-5]NIB99101.1 hypothetical protein [Halobacterium sp. R2-5]